MRYNFQKRMTMLSSPKEITNSIIHWIIYIFFLKIALKWKKIKTTDAIFLWP